MDDHRQIERTAAAWLARRDGDAWSEPDQAALQAWLEASPAHKVAWLRLQAAWDHGERLRALPQRPASAPAADAATFAQLRFAAPTHEPRQQRRPRRRAGWAALVATAVLAILLANPWPHPAAGAAPQVYATALGQVRSFALVDGSQATLSSDSRIAVRIGGGQRRIALERGEAFFSVAHDPAHPFVVAVDGHEAVAVGTRYAVWRRAGEALRVVVTEGTVRLQAPLGSAAPQLLPAGSIAEVDATATRVRRLDPAAAERYVDWRSGFLDFQAVPLAEAVAEFNRYNRLQLGIADPQTAALPVGGHFRWDNVEAFVRLLELGFPVCSARTPERVLLRHCPGP